VRNKIALDARGSPYPTLPRKRGRRLMITPVAAEDGVGQRDGHEARANLISSDAR
jgi:hypothetical protein